MEVSKTHVLLALGGAGLIWLWTSAQNVKNSIAGLDFSFAPAGFRFIGISEMEVSIRVTVRNPGFAELPIQGLNIAIERISGKTSIPFAATDPAGVSTPIIKARDTTTFVLPLRTGTLQGIMQLWQTIQQRGMNQFRMVGTIQAAGLSVPISPVPFHL